jgi:hypothetical protein
VQHIITECAFSLVSFLISLTLAPDIKVQLRQKRR